MDLSAILSFIAVIIRTVPVHTTEPDLSGCKNCTELGLETLKYCTLKTYTECGNCSYGYYNKHHKGIKTYPPFCAKCEPETKDEACKNVTLKIVLGESTESKKKSSRLQFILILSIGGVVVTCFIVLVVMVIRKFYKKTVTKNEEIPMAYQNGGNSGSNSEGSANQLLLSNAEDEDNPEETGDNHQSLLSHAEDIDNPEESEGNHQSLLSHAEDIDNPEETGDNHQSSLNIGAEHENPRGS